MLAHGSSETKVATFPGKDSIRRDTLRRIWNQLQSARRIPKGGLIDLPVLLHLCLNSF